MRQQRDSVQPGQIVSTDTGSLTCLVLCWGSLRYAFGQQLPHELPGWIGLVLHSVCGDGRGELVILSYTPEVAEGWAVL